MKTIYGNRLMVQTLFLFMVLGTCVSMAQSLDKNMSTKISYKVDFGPVYPIEADSYQVVGKATLNDVTGEPESIGFNVPLNSFVGPNQGYLAWIGNSWENPDMTFKSTEIIKKDDVTYTVKGRLEFRRRGAPIAINFKRQDANSEIMLEGDFEMDTNDYFTISPPIRLVPARIPFKITLVFDKPVQNGRQISFH